MIEAKAEGVYAVSSLTVLDAAGDKTELDFEDSQLLVTAYREFVAVNSQCPLLVERGAFSAVRFHPKKLGKVFTKNGVQRIRLYTDEHDI